jgi:hypothetical protein
MIGFNPWFRAWSDQSWRTALNAALYPNGASIPTGPRKAAPDATEPAKAPIAKSELPPVANRPVIKSHDAALKDIRIVSIKRGHMRGLRKILRKADVPARIEDKARFTMEGGKAALTIRGERIADQELRPEWMLDLGQNARDSSFAITNT